LIHRFLTVPIGQKEVFVDLAIQRIEGINNKGGFNSEVQLL